MKKLVPAMLGFALIAGACGGGTTVLGGGESFCDVGTERARQEAEFEDIDFTDPDSVEAAFKASRDLINQAVGIAPDDIAADMKLVREDFLLAFDAFEAADWDAFAIGDFEVLPEADAASERLDDYFLAECGIDLTESEGPTEEELIEQLESSDRGGDLIIAGLVQAGVDPDEAACLAETIELDEFIALSEGSAPDDILSRFSDCGVSLADLAEFGGSDPDDLVVDGIPLEVPDEVLELFVTQFVEAGFTQDEAVCIAQSMFGGDALTANDPLAAFETCDISLARMAELGDLGG